MSTIPNETGPKYQDLINFTPHVIVNINEDQRQLILKHDIIIKALKTSQRTVKELHSLFLNEEEIKFSKTLKTIYRYVAALEEANLVKNCGQRMTEGSRIIEKVYSLTARYFYFSKPELQWWQTSEASDFSNNLGLLLSNILDDEKYLDQSSLNSIHQLCKIEAEFDYFNVLEIVEKIHRDPKLKEIVPIDYFEEDKLITYASKLITYLRNFEMLKQFRKISDEDQL